MIKLNENEKEKIQVISVEDKALLVLTNKYVGVTDNLNDIMGVIKECQNGEKPIEIIPGYKSRLLNLQHSILLMDEVCNSLGKEEIAIPDKVNDYNLTERKRTEETEKFLPGALSFAHEK